jgi:phosphate transport system permease protein
MRQAMHQHLVRAEEQLGRFLIVLIVILFTVSVLFLIALLFIQAILSEEVIKKAANQMDLLLSTLLLLFASMAIAFPPAAMAAVYLTEYAPDNKTTAALRMGITILDGLPSIFAGLTGLLIFSRWLGFGTGFLTTALTLSLLVQPSLIHSFESSLKAVPQAVRDGSLSLGAGRFQTLFKVVMPSALPEILSGLSVSMVRILGETAVLLFTLSPKRGFSVLPFQVYIRFTGTIEKSASLEGALIAGALLMVLVFLFKTVAWITAPGEQYE